MSNFAPLRTTVTGGLVFLIPLIFVFVLGAKAIEIMRHIATPIVELLDLRSTIVGVAVADLVTVLVILSLCYLAGLLARSTLGSRIYQFVDEKLISIIPQYAFVKSMAPAGNEAELERALRPVLVRLDDSAVMAFVAEEPRDGLATVYVPGAPNPWSGSIMHVDEERVEPLDVRFSEVVSAHRVLGRGSAELMAAGGVSSAEVARRLAP